MANTIEIPREQWSLFFDALNRSAGGQPVRIEVENLEEGSQEMARQLPLQEINFETRGSGQGQIEIVVGSDAGELTHSIEEAARVYVEQRDDGAPECIAIESRDGVKTLLWSEHFATLPEHASDSHAGAP